MSNATTTPATIEIPSILTQNCFYRKPNSVASCRRRNEERRQDEVFNFLKRVGFEVERKGDSVRGRLNELYIEFSYYETCGNVYKSLYIERNGKKSNISALKKLLA